MNFDCDITIPRLKLQGHLSHSFVKLSERFVNKNKLAFPVRGCYVEVSDVKLNRNFKFVHNTVTFKAQGRRKYVCYVCLERFNSPFELYKHKDTHKESEDEEVKGENQDLETRRKKYKAAPQSSSRSQESTNTINEPTILEPVINELTLNEKVQNSESIPNNPVMSTPALNLNDISEIHIVNNIEETIEYLQNSETVSIITTDFSFNPETENIAEPNISNTDEDGDEEIKLTADKDSVSEEIDETDETDDCVISTTVVSDVTDMFDDQEVFIIEDEKVIITINSDTEDTNNCENLICNEELDPVDTVTVEETPVVAESLDSPAPEVTSMVNFKCSTCKLNLITFKKFVYHVNVFFTHRDFYCTYCNRTFVTPESACHDMSRHTYSFNFFSCSFCTSYFLSYASLRTHLIESHRFSPLTTALNLFEVYRDVVKANCPSVYQCTKCSNIFESKKSMEVHSAFHNETDSLPKALPNPKPIRSSDTLNNVEQNSSKGNSNKKFIFIPGPRKGLTNQSDPLKSDPLSVSSPSFPNASRFSSSPSFQYPLPKLAPLSKSNLPKNPSEKPTTSLTDDSQFLDQINSGTTFSGNKNVNARSVLKPSTSSTRLPNFYLVPSSNTDFQNVFTSTISKSKLPKKNL